jgi:hypothetical protein
LTEWSTTLIGLRQFDQDGAAVSVSGITAQIAADAVGYGEGVCCVAAMTTRTAA